MTKEELEKKAENFIIDRYKLNECYREDNAETREYMRMDVHSQYEEEYQLYLAVAEPREKRITGLSKHILELQKDKGNLIDRCRELEQQNNWLEGCKSELGEHLGKANDRIAVLEKRCANYEMTFSKMEKGTCDICKEIEKDKKIEELEAQIKKMKVKWHDLEKDPNDLPKDYKTMCICLSDFGSKYEPVPRVCVGYCDSLGWSDYMGSSLYSTVRYWCELPK